MHDVLNPDTYENLDLSARDNDLYVVTLNRPSKRNALDVATIEELIRFFSGARMAGVGVGACARGARELRPASGIWNTLGQYTLPRLVKHRMVAWVLAISRCSTKSSSFTAVADLPMPPRRCAW